MAEPQVDPLQPEFPSRRAQTLLAREVLACEDPCCCCEPEPRWLQLQHETENPGMPSEWDIIDRSPRDEF